MTDFIEQSKFEHRFWLQVLGDHSRFIYNSLSPQEIELIPIAKFFINRFDQLLERAQTEMDAGGWQGLAREVLPAVEELRKFKLDILSRHLQKKVQIRLSPTFFNHMLNELDEYRKNLGYQVQGQVVPVKSPVHHHLLWIKDAEGHARAVHCDLDFSQTKLILAAREYMELFCKRYSETVEYAGFLRTGKPMFPSLGKFDRDVAGEIAEFKEFLEFLKLMIGKAEVIGPVNALVPDHMAREECYYLHRLHRSDPQNVPRPECDPTRPRVTD